MPATETRDYFALNNREPLIRVMRGGLPVGAMRIDRQTGEFAIQNTLLSVIETSPDIDEISELRFFELVESFRRTLRQSP